MAELTPKERLQPSLLDRLIDDDPTNPQEGRDSRVMSMPRLREAVLRDLRWLLNTTNLSGTRLYGHDDPLDGYPNTADSVLNYGMPDLTGYTSSGIDEAQVEKLVKEAIRRFEPRIVRKLKVRALTNPDQMNANALCFEIDGELWGQPMPERLYLRTEIDLETGSATVTEAVD